jgi:hypothetical protein
MLAEVHTSPSLVIQAFVFAKAQWDFQGSFEHGDWNATAVPGTWNPGNDPSLETTTLKKIAHALVCCPNCRSVSILHKQITTVDRLGHVDPHFRCMYKDDYGVSCGFHRDAYLDEWTDGKFLYAMSYHSRRGIQIMHTHADSVEAARLAIPHVKREDIIAIGRAVGFAGEYADAPSLAAAVKRGEA